jgi:hypothetical protein
VDGEGLDRGLHLRAVRRHQVDDLDGDLVDVVDDVGGLALEQREPEQADQRGEDAEERAVERLGDAAREVGRLVAALGATDRAERADPP